MNRLITKSLVLVALVGAMTAFAASKTEAAFLAAICDDALCDGVGDVIVTDGGAGDASGTAGVISVTNSIGGFDATVNIANSKPQLTEPQMDLGFVASGAGEAWFYAVDNDFTALVAGLSATIDGNQAAGGTIDMILCGGADNNTGTLNNCDTSGTIATGTYSVPLSILVNTNPYAITLGVHIVRTSSNVTSGDFLLSPVPVPEPATMSLLGLGLAGVAAFRRRRQQA